ncbi:MAG TPA: signal peptidase I [Clostridia bacterium]|nr:signal peptidase I [Clostridia bacterium]
MQTSELPKREKRAFLDASAWFHKDDEAYKSAENRSLFFYVALVAVFALAFRLFIFEPIRVDGPSMESTLFNNEQMFVEKANFWFEAPKHGEIVIVYYPGYTIPAVKRVIGLPGEAVAVTDGAVYVNGAAIDESAYWNGFILGDMAPVTVPENCIFVMGDNRNNSKDSRDLLEVGPIPYYRIVGRARAVIWPVSNFRPL